MSGVAYDIRLEVDSDSSPIDELHREALGPGQYAKTAYRIREGYQSDSRLCFVAQQEKEILASVRLTPIFIGRIRGQLLGPLAVKPKFKNEGIGKSILRKTLLEAEKLTENHILLVGDESYYGAFGFKRIRNGVLKMPGPVDPERLLVALLGNGQIDSAEMSGLVRGRRIEF